MKYSPINDNAFEQGFDAYAKGYNSDVNPYTKQSPGYISWYIGWLAATGEIGEL